MFGNEINGSYKMEFFRGGSIRGMLIQLEKNMSESNSSAILVGQHFSDIEVYLTSKTHPNGDPLSMLTNMISQAYWIRKWHSED